MFTSQFPAIFSSLLLFYSLPILFKIRTRDYFPFLICCSVGDLKKSHYGSHVSDHMSWIYNDMLNTIVTFFDQSDCSVHRMQSSLIQVFIVSQFIWCCIWQSHVTRTGVSSYLPVATYISKGEQVRDLFLIRLIHYLP